MTLQIALKQFADFLRIECGLADNSLRAYSQDLHDLLAWLAAQGLTDPGEVRIVHIQGWLKDLTERGYATSSIARKLAAVRMFWRHLFANGHTRQDLVQLLEAPKIWHRLPRIVDPRQVATLLEEPGEDDPLALRDRAILEMFYACGLRVSELAGLTPKDVNLQVGFVRCMGKGRKERIVPIGSPALGAIRQYLAVLRPELTRRAETDRLFVSRTGKRLDRHNLYRLVQRYARRAGITAKMTPHSLRHCFASHLLSGGADLRVVQELLGHASVTTTQVYTHVDRERLKRIHRKYHPLG